MNPFQLLLNLSRECVVVWKNYGLIIIYKTLLLKKEDLAYSQGSFPLVYEMVLKLNQKFLPIMLFVSKLQFEVISTVTLPGTRQPYQSMCAVQGREELGPSGHSSGSC